MGVGYSVDVDRKKVDEIIAKLKKDLKLSDRKAYLEELSRTNGGPLLVKAAREWKKRLIEMKDELNRLEFNENKSDYFAHLQSTFNDQFKKSQETLTLAKTIPALEIYIQEIQPAPETSFTKKQNQEQPKTQPKRSSPLLFKPKQFQEVEISDEEMANSVFGRRLPNRYNPLK